MTFLRKPDRLDLPGDFVLTVGSRLARLTVANLTSVSPKFLYSNVTGHPNDGDSNDSRIKTGYPQSGEKTVDNLRSCSFNSESRPACKN